MGSGKSSIGRILARKLDREFVDLDREIERRAGRSIPEIFGESGESRFRELEHDALLDALDDSRAPVVACGGGTVVHPGSRERLKTTTTVFLEEDVKVLYDRTRSASRPLRGAGYDEFERRYAERLPYYLETADLTIRACGRSQERIAEEVLRWLDA